ADISVNTPDIAENGAVVPVGAASKIPNTTDMWFFVEKNPYPLAASFSFPEGTDPEVKTRVKMGTSTQVTVVVKAGGELYAASKETKVTLGGCGG
ncbi:MAG: thiosulfate oxidation carrier protein SoxY, partial [Burkholderiaceae bacterium]|nr:thiosulfate oxidation carrier protein SoxY [Burkholderiaceae bacterium]